jgi:hypothetical protein
MCVCVCVCVYYLICVCVYIYILWYRRRAEQACALRPRNGNDDAGEVIVNSELNLAVKSYLMGLTIGEVIVNS